MGVDLLNVEGLEELDRQSPVVMVNLMRFIHARSTAMARAGTPICATAR